jgi:cell division protein FtsL
MKTPNIPAVVEPTVSTEHKERRYVYDGNYRKPAPSPAPRSNRPVRPRKRSLFSIITMLVAISFLIVFYIWNKISVNRLTDEIYNIQRDIDIANGKIEYLGTQISKKKDLDRITNYATEKLDFIQSNKSTIPLFIDFERLKRLQEE